MSGVFFFFFLGLGGGGQIFGVFDPFSSGGNFGLHSTRTVYSSFYGTVTAGPPILEKKN